MSKIEAKIEALFSHYLHKPSGETVAALKFPVGYEDRNPHEFEGVPGTEKAAPVDAKVSPVLTIDPNAPAPTEVNTPVVDSVPVAPAPSAGDTGEEATPVE